MSINKKLFRSGPYADFFSQGVQVGSALYLAGQVGADGLVLYDVVTPGQGSFFGSSTCWQASASFIQFE
jgi:hypothetical protein